MRTKPKLDYDILSTDSLSQHREINARKPIHGQTTDPKLQFATMKQLSDYEDKLDECETDEEKKNYFAFNTPSYDVAAHPRKTDPKVQVNCNKSRQQYGSNRNLLICCSCVIAIIVYFVVPVSENGETIEPASKLKNQIKILSKDFPTQQKDTLIALWAGIKKVVADNPNVPSVFLLLHNNDDETSACLARKVGVAAMEFFNSSSENPVELHGLDLENNQTLLEDYGHLIEDYSTMVKERHMMIVHDLHKIPALIAQAFHVFCDTDNPLVNRAVILFTMEVSEILTRENPTIQAEYVLKKLWGKSLEKDIMDPLMTRITNYVLYVHPEKNLPC